MCEAQNHIGMTRFTASIVISTYAASRLERAANAIASVERQDNRNFEIIFVIDQDNDLVERVYREITGSVRIIINPHPGMANARNVGLAEARGDVVVFMDDDAVAEPNWLGLLLAHYEDDRVVSVGGCSIPEWEGGAPLWLPEELLWVVGCTYRGFSSNNGDVRNVLGCNMSFRASAIRGLGGFKLGRARYWQITSGTAEETEFCLRLTAAVPNAKIVYEPRAVVHHWVPKSRLRIGYILRRAVGEGVAKARLQRVHASKPTILSHEWTYLRELILNYVPQTFGSYGLKGAHLAAVQVLVVLLVVAATGAGYAWTRLRDVFCI